MGAYEKRASSSFDYESNPTGLAVPVRDEKESDSQRSNLGPFGLSNCDEFGDGGAGDSGFVRCIGCVQDRNSRTANS